MRARILQEGSHSLAPMTLQMADILLCADMSPNKRNSKVASSPEHQHVAQSHKRLQIGPSQNVVTSCNVRLQG